MSDNEKKDVLEKVSQGRRDFVRKAASAGFVIPVVGTFTVTGLMSNAEAVQSNQSPPPHKGGT